MIACVIRTVLVQHKLLCQCTSFEWFGYVSLAGVDAASAKT
jgi:hypothetical protein